MSTTPLRTPSPSPAVQKVLKSRDPTQELLSELRGMAIDQPKLVKATAYSVHRPRPDAPSPPPGEPPAPKTITSWKMLEHLYRQSPCPFPTLARGLFTTWTSESGVPEPSIKDATKGTPAEQRRTEEEGGKWRIVARGYDKFFNVGEVGWTEWGSLAMNTSGPYELTLKSNGCLILVAALTPSRLLVTSKHSLGTRNPGAPAPLPTKAKAEDPQDPDEDADATEVQPDGALQTSHAERGEQWLFAHLKEVGKTEADLAKVLWERNISAVAELCDDTFEEHVLPIPEDLTGLVLHGLVPNSPAFESLPAQEVAQFAKDWGFKPTEIVTLHSVKAVIDFCKEGAKKGEWEGIGVEGWVVRCRVKDPNEIKAEVERENGSVDELAEQIANLVVADPGDAPVKADKRGKSTKTPPYPPGAPFFFKVKFEEPYLMYREWRELTKILLPVIDGAPIEGRPDTQKTRQEKGKKELKPVKISDRFKKRPETRVYTDWVLREMKANPESFKNYRYNRGIIETRDRFLKWASTPGQGKEAWDKVVGKGAGTAASQLEGKQVDGKQEQKVLEAKVPKGKENWKKTIIVPVAIPGCGKTSVAIALKELYGIGHTQSDDVKAKSTGPQFIKNVIALLDKHDVAFADRNNHLEQHRKQIREAAEKYTNGPVRLVGMNWSLTSAPISTVHRLTSTRLIARGENHQSLRAQKDNVAFHEDVLWKFITSAEPLDEDEVDATIEMDARDGFEDTIRRGVKDVAALFGWELPSEEKMLRAIENARNYKVDKRTKDDPSAARKEKVQYYAILAEIDLPSVLGELLADGKGADPAITKFWNHLTEQKRVNKRPHITLAHSADPASEEKEAFWADCAAVASSADPPLYEFAVSHVVCDGKVMSLVVDPGSLQMRKQAQKGEDAVLEKPTGPGWDGERMNKLHVTVGTKGAEVKNVEGGRLVREWREGKVEGGQVLKLETPLRVVGTLKGMAY